MATTYTSLLGLALPTTGELQGTWGDTVNNSITSLLDSAVAGTTTLSTDGDVTLTTTTGAANQARQAILLCSGARTAQRTITAPAQSKIYTVINATSGGFAVKLVGVGPTTGVTIPAGSSGMFAWNGSDFVDVSNYVNGNKIINGNLTVNGNTTLGDASGDSLTINAGTVTLNQGTANGVAYLNGSKVLTTGTALTFDGTSTFNVVSSSQYPLISVASTAANNIFGFRMDGSTGSGNGRDWRIEQGRNAVGQFNITDITAGNTVRYSIGSDGTAIWNVGAGTGSEQMRLNSTGLGIGTSSPWTKLSVYGSGNQRIAVTSPTGGATVAAIDLSPSLTAGEAASYDPQARIYAVDSNYSANIIFANKATGATANTLQTRMTLDTSGNLGLGVAPSAWFSVYKPMQLGSYGAAIAGQTNAQSLSLWNNAYPNASNVDTYTTTNAANKFRMDGGAFQFFTAPSGTAGNAITFTQAMTLDASSNLAVGTTATGVAKLNLGSGSGNNAIALDSWTIAKYTGTEIQWGGVNASNWTTASFYTGGSERARIDSSGNLGIGTTSPTWMVSVRKDSAGVSSGQYPVVQINNANASGYAALYLNDSAAQAGLETRRDTAHLGFYAGGSERARIDSSGNLLVGTTDSSPSAGNGVKLVKNRSGISEYNAVSVVSNVNNSSYSTYELYTSTGGAGYKFYVTYNGTISAVTTTITGISDERLKENIRDLDEGLDVVMRLKPRKFDWKEGKGAGTKNARGFIAQEFETVLPDMVEEWKDPAPEGEEPYKAVNANLIPTLVKALQEMKTIIDQQAERIAALEAK